MPRLTDLDCKRAKPGDELRDQTPNLVLRVGSRTKAWTLVWRDGKQVRKAILGHYTNTPSGMSLQEARIAALEGMERVRQGAEPTKPQKALESLPDPAVVGLTVKGVLDSYLTRHADRTARSAPRLHRVADTVLKPLHRIPVGDLTRAKVTSLLDEIADERGLASSYQAGTLLRAAWRFALRRGEVEKDVLSLLVLPGRGEPRTRFLSLDEARAVWKTDVPHWSRLARVLLMSGLRLREAAQGRRSELEEGCWRIPAARMKQGAEHVVPLFPALAQAVAGEGEFIFPGRFPDSPIAGFTKGLAAVQKASGTDGWCWHDLRRTVATGCQRLGTPEIVIDGILAHAQSGIRRHYHQHNHFEERAQALALWTKQLSDEGN